MYKTCPFGINGLHFGNECLCQFPAGYGVPFPTDEPTDVIPRSCQLTTDVPQVTQLLNMTKLRQTEIKFGGHPLRSAESGMQSGAEGINIFICKTKKRKKRKKASLAMMLYAGG